MYIGPVAPTVYILPCILYKKAISLISTYDRIREY